MILNPELLEQRLSRWLAALEAIEVSDDAVCFHLGHHFDHGLGRAGISTAWYKKGSTAGVLVTYYFSSYDLDFHRFSKEDVVVFKEIVERVFGPVIDEWNGEGCGGISVVAARDLPKMWAATKRYGKAKPFTRETDERLKLWDEALEHAFQKVGGRI